MSVQNALIPVHFEKILQTRGYCVILLSALEKQIAIYAESSVGKNLQIHLTEGEKLRPLSHDLLSMILSGFDIEVIKVVISDLKETVYYSKIFLQRRDNEKVRRILELDARPSDALLIAIVKKAPIFCTQQVLETAFSFELASELGADSSDQSLLP